MLDRAALAGETLAAARGLLGAYLVREDATGRRAGRIVEVEAYIGRADRASHARFGRTARNAVMFGPPGIAYVYLVYGMYHCLNVVTELEGHPAALLVRAVAPVEGVAQMRASRVAAAAARRRLGTDAIAVEERRVGALAPARLASGPGLVGAAFGLDTGWTGADLCDPSSALRLEPPPPDWRPPTILATPRVGIGYAGEPWTSRPWRFVVAGDPAVSRIGGGGDGHGGPEQRGGREDAGGRVGRD